MQTARILFPRRGKTGPLAAWLNKATQTLRALQLEWRYSKNEILALYLTHAPFGGNIQGVWAASYTYLGKGPEELSRAEAALLAVLPQAPSRFRPDRHPQRAQGARDKVLDRLAEFKVWSREEVNAAKMEPVNAFRFAPPCLAPLAARRLRNTHPNQAVIHSCLDYDLQIHTEDLLRRHMVAPRQSGAVLATDLRDLAVRVYAGSGDFTNALGAGQVDMVTALRSPGSTLKPFIYGMAIEQGLIHSHSLLMDSPRHRSRYAPANFTGGFLGPVTATQALRLSLNVPAVQVLESLGPLPFHDRLKHAGARMALRGKPNLSLALGGMGTNLESLATLYTALGRAGQAGSLRLTPDSPVTQRFLMAPGAAYIVKQMLTRSLPGRGGLLPLSGGRPMAWKTGTSYGFRDAWALGIAGNWLVGVWMGRPDGTPSPGQYGAVTALPLLQQVMDSLPPNAAPPSRPQTVDRQTIAWPSGLAIDRDPGPGFQRHHAWIFKGQIPPTQWQNQALVQRIWVDDQGLRATPQCGGTHTREFALWPPPARAWLPPQWRNQRLIPNPSPACPDIAALAPSPLEITIPAPDSRLTRPPGQNPAPRIPLEATGGRGKCSWFLNGTPLPEESRDFAMPRPGRYQLIVVDETGNLDQIHFEVMALAP